jgi:hypothetical protein
MANNRQHNLNDSGLDFDLRDSQDALFEEPVSSSISSSVVTDSSENDEQTDFIDVAFMAMGGFGRLQKYSYVMNTLTQGAAAFFIYALVFLEKHPVYEC